MWCSGCANSPSWVHHRLPKQTWDGYRWKPIDRWPHDAGQLSESAKQRPCWRLQRVPNQRPNMTPRRLRICTSKRWDLLQRGQMAMCCTVLTLLCVCVCMCGRQEREHEAMVAEQAEQLRVLRGQYAEVRVLHDMSKYVRSWSRDPCVRAYAMQATARATAAEEHTARIDNENKRLQRELLRCGEECANVAHVCGHAVCLRNVCSGLELRQLHNTHLAAADSLGVHRRNPLLLQVVVALTGPWIFGSETKLV